MTRKFNLFTLILAWETDENRVIHLKTVLFFIFFLTNETNNIFVI